MKNSEKSFINNCDIENNETSEEEKLRELEEEQNDYIQKLYDNGEFVDYHTNNNVINNGKANKKESKEKQESLKEIFSQKYKGHDYLAEAVIIGSKPYFAVSSKLNINNKFSSINLHESIQLDEQTLLKPPEFLSYLNRPYVFTSEEDFYRYIGETKQIDLYTLFKQVKSIWKKYIDADNFHLSICAADTIFTYLQDKIGLTHYLFFIGSNGSGKSNNLVIFNYLGIEI